MQYCDVIVKSLSPAFAHGLTYACTEGEVLQGQIVSVPLQRKLTEGIVIRTHRRRPKGNYIVRPIRKILGETPLLSGPQLETVLWIAEHECCTIRQAMSVVFPGRGRWSSFLPLGAPQLPTPRRKRIQPMLLIASYGERAQEYLKAIQEAFSRNQSVMLIAPFQKRAEEWARLLKQEQRWEVMFFTSALRERERREHFKRCFQGDARIVVGTRSALFLPLRNPGLIIVDDEHNPLFKADRTPRYHAREVARALADRAGARLILSSSCPSVESWWAATCKAYELKQRTTRKPPRVSIVDLTDAPCSPYPLSLSLLSFLERAVKGERSIAVFLNDRRGLAEAESILRQRFSHARMHFGTSSLFSLHMDFAVDVAIALNADIGSSTPNFRVSEWTFQRLVSLRNLAHEHLVIQTHRPDATEIRAAAMGNISVFLDAEIEERKRAGYPPFQSLTRLIVKGGNSAQRASQLVSALKEEGINATIAPPFRGNVWQVFLRGKEPQAVLQTLDLKDVSVDREPVEW